MERPTSVAKRLARRGPADAGEARRPRVCLVACGSVAAVKLPQIIAALVDAGCDVDALLTPTARRFVESVQYSGQTGSASLRTLQEAHGRRLEVWYDEDEWSDYETVGVDPVLHIELARTCDVLLFAPLDANTLAKAALGLSDNLASCVLRAWPYDLVQEPSAPLPRSQKPVLVTPAMNSVMWLQNITHQHLKTLETRGVQVIPPVSKLLACGDLGMGAMADPLAIARATRLVIEKGGRGRVW
ncbi:flavoprotein, partial [Pavlovales sp. CCMP2436]